MYNRDNDKLTKQQTTEYVTHNYSLELEVDGEPVGERLRPDVRTHTQTDGQPENIMPPVPLSRINMLCISDSAVAVVIFAHNGQEQAT